MKKGITTLCASVATFTLAFAVPAVTLAQNPFQEAQKKATDVGTKAGVTGSTDLVQIVGKIINVALGFLGIVFLVLLLYAGFRWMTGGEDGVKEARKMVMNSIIGLIIIVAAFAISNFVLSSLVNVSQ
jgi:tetrahydromethanopterin S-methyltransferase subunit G